jgi:hypothetical protein
MITEDLCLAFNNKQIYSFYELIQSNNSDGALK